MLRNRRGITPIEIILLILVFVLLIGGYMLWNRVSQLNAWAAGQDTWNAHVYKWINESSFQQGNAVGASDPDVNKPPPPPPDL